MAAFLTQITVHMTTETHDSEIVDAANLLRLTVKPLSSSQGITPH